MKMKKPRTENVRGVRTLFCFLHKLFGIFCDHELLIGRDDVYLYLGGRRGKLDDIRLTPCLGVELAIDFDAEKAHVAADTVAQLGIVFAHAGSKDDSVKSVHGGGIRADIF